ncbi:MAG: hypothetical protein BGO38_07020 [Cellulomonas sp. 73-145]|uniref:hypothetical protein n=1 Tax=Cellulomonas sp. 73-145 TaxID=1895739 RepID=UPI00092BF156|nr:hypothetical protein [Cellulomonas sp. 73-145]MBN9328089.1 hypothetical protein [Cellulomonas sp.]OJV57968.1 MAG: hypothetical protein BGO38_07020 [Cellulomonas sp. 73-145]
MIALALAALLYVTPSPSWTPGPDDPVCEPGQSVQVDHCAQGQLPTETTGREYDPAPAPSPAAIALPHLPAAAPGAPSPARPSVRVLAQTGVPLAPYAAVGALLVGSGAMLVRVSRRASR